MNQQVTFEHYPTFHLVLKITVVVIRGFCHISGKVLLEIRTNNVIGSSVPSVDEGLLLVILITRDNNSSGSRWFPCCEIIKYTCSVKGNLKGLSVGYLEVTHTPEVFARLIGNSYQTMWM